MGLQAIFMHAAKNGRLDGYLFTGFHLISSGSAAHAKMAVAPRGAVIDSGTLPKRFRAEKEGHPCFRKKPRRLFRSSQWAAEMVCSTIRFRSPRTLLTTSLPIAP